jgi:uncharacterized membrane protein
LLGLMLGLVFLVWILTAQGNLRDHDRARRRRVARRLRARGADDGPGWAMIVLGCGVGFLFAAAVLVTSVVSFPLLLDRPVGLPVAVATSIRVAAASPGPIAAWGLIVAAGLALGSLPLFLGLVFVLPVLGHATWHLYRRAVAEA